MLSHEGPRQAAALRRCAGIERRSCGGPQLDIEVVKLEIRRAEDIGPAFETLKEPVDALYVCSDPLVLTNRIRINTSALVARLPTIYGFREFVEAGGLISYGPNFQDLIGAPQITSIRFSGGQAADIPVEQPTKYDLIINQYTARAIRLPVPPSLLARADEVIE